jgi:hydroxymethylpyrimidine/phosphomethylpyrimidine kinase
LKVVLTVAGSDSGGGAGIQADLKTILAHGLHGATAVAAVTAQNSLSVARWAPVEADLVVAQIEAVASDMEVAAVKTGMLGTVELIAAVAETLARRRLPAVVVDPVLRASSGSDLAEAGATRAYLDRLFPVAAVVTPNLAEAGALLGRPVRSLEEARAAGSELARRGPAVVIKGGHLEGDPVDVFADARRVVELAGPRLATADVHGTGCVFSAALACRLALGDDPLEAARAAKAFTAEAIRRAYAVGAGSPVLGYPR